MDYPLFIIPTLPPSLRLELAMGLSLWPRGMSMSLAPFYWTKATGLEGQRPLYEDNSLFGTAQEVVLL